VVSPGITTLRSFRGNDQDVRCKPSGPAIVSWNTSSKLWPVMFSRASPRSPYAAFEYIGVWKVPETGWLLRSSFIDSALMSAVRSNPTVSWYLPLREHGWRPNEPQDILSVVFNGGNPRRGKGEFGSVDISRSASQHQQSQFVSIYAKNSKKGHNYNPV
jgi:hypothetical protein